MTNVESDSSLVIPAAAKRRAGNHCESTTPSQWFPDSATRFRDDNFGAALTTMEADRKVRVPREGGDPATQTPLHCPLIPAQAGTQGKTHGRIYLPRLSAMLSETTALRTRLVPSHIDFSEWPSFYIHTTRHEEGQLDVVVGSADTPIVTIIFDRPDAFAFFRESDFFQKMSGYSTEPRNVAREKDCGLFRITGPASVIAFGPDYLEPPQAPPRYFIGTP